MDISYEKSIVVTFEVNHMTLNNVYLHNYIFLRLILK